MLQRFYYRNRRGRKFCVFYKKNEKRGVKEFINLTNVNYCKAINQSRTVRNKDEVRTLVDQLELGFYSGQNKVEAKFEFYNSEDTLQVYKERECIEKWERIINDHLKKA